MSSQATGSYTTLQISRVLRSFWGFGRSCYQAAKVYCASVATVRLQVRRGLAGSSQCQSLAASNLPHSPQCPEEPSVPHSKLLVGQNCLAEHAAHRRQQAKTAHRPSAQARPGASAPAQSKHDDLRCDKGTNIHRLYSTPVVSYLGVAFEPL